MSITNTQRVLWWNQKSLRNRMEMCGATGQFTDMCIYMCLTHKCKWLWALPIFALGSQKKIKSLIIILKKKFGKHEIYSWSVMSYSLWLSRIHCGPVNRGQSRAFNSAIFIFLVGGWESPYLWHAAHAPWKLSSMLRTGNFYHVLVI
jgi:hypothetical protein